MWKYHKELLSKDGLGRYNYHFELVSNKDGLRVEVVHYSFSERPTKRHKFRLKDVWDKNDKRNNTLCRFIVPDTVMWIVKYKIRNDIQFQKLVQDQES